MVQCAKCGGEMAVFLRYRRDQPRTYYAFECVACLEKEKAAQVGQAEPDVEKGDDTG